jgi:hypothetical protein
VPRPPPPKPPLEAGLERGEVLGALP